MEDHVTFFNLSSNVTSSGCSKNLSSCVDLDQLYSFESVVGIVVPIVFGLLAVTGLIGNLLVVLFVATGGRVIHSTTNVLIGSLAAADLMFIVTCVPFTAAEYALTFWPFGDIWCKIYQYVINVTAYASVYTLVLMSLDRYLAVVHPIGSVILRTERNAAVLAAVSWLVILCGNVPVMAEHGAIEYMFADGQNRSACMNYVIYAGDFGGKAAETSIRYSRIFYGCFFVFAYVLPLSIISVLYGLMVRRLAHRSASRQTNQSKRHVTRLVLVVVLTFAACWLPLQVVLVVQFVAGYTDHGTWFVTIKIASNCLAYTNSCVNPVLYAFLSDAFRKSFRRVFYCGLASPRQGRTQRFTMDVVYERCNINHDQLRVRSG